MDIGFKLGLISQEVYAAFEDRQKKIQREVSRLNKTYLKWESPDIQERWAETQMPIPSSNLTLGQVLRRPEMNYQSLLKLAGEPMGCSDSIGEAVEISIKYDGYIKRQLMQIEKFKKLDSKPIPEDFPYWCIKGFSNEVQEKLSKVKPGSIGQASRISGVTPAAISLLLVALEKETRT